MENNDKEKYTCESCVYHSLSGSSSTCMRCLSNLNTRGVKSEYMPISWTVQTGVVAVPPDFDVAGCFIDQLREELDRKDREAKMRKMIDSAFLTPNEMRRMLGMDEIKEPVLKKEEQPLYKEGYEAGYAAGRESVIKELGIQQFQYDFLKTVFTNRKEEENVSSEAE